VEENYKKKSSTCYDSLFAQKKRARTEKQTQNRAHSLFAKQKKKKNPREGRHSLFLNAPAARI
jgi:hypothetical protein